MKLQEVQLYEAAQDKPRTILTKFAKDLLKDAKALAKDYAADDYWDIPRGMQTKLQKLGTKYGKAAYRALKKAGIDIEGEKSPDSKYVEDKLHFGPIAEILYKIADLYPDAQEAFKDEIIPWY